MKIDHHKIANIAPIPHQEFADEIPVMYAPMREYVLRLMPLMLEHAWQQKEQRSVPAIEALHHCGWIGRLITLDNRVLNHERQDEIQGWTELRQFLTESLERCKKAVAVPEMLAQCMQRISPILEKRFVQDFRFPERQFHCWWYTIHDDNTHLALHLINAYQPGSPFDHLDHFLFTMFQAFRHGIAAYPGISVVSCGSWLNQLHRFQQLWPHSFKHNQKILNETGGFGPGIWGQYMTNTGGFNDTKADILRTTGKHPYALTEARCSAAELGAHLEKLIYDVKG